MIRRRFVFQPVIRKAIREDDALDRRAEAFQKIG